MTTPHSDRITNFARRVRERVLRIEGPVAWITIHNLKGLHEALGHKIEELEQQTASPRHERTLATAFSADELDPLECIDEEPH